MHPKKIKFMKDKIRDCFTKCSLKDGDSDPDVFIPLLKRAAKEVCKGKDQWIDEWQVIMLLHRKAYLELRVIPEETRKAASNFTEIVDAKNIEKIVEETTNFLNSIPREYHFYFKLPQFNDSAYSLYSATKDLSLIRVEDEPFDIAKALQAAKKKEVTFIEEKKFGLNPGTYVRVKVIGYTDNEYNCNTIAEAFSKFKQFIYLNYLKGNIVLNTLYSGWGRPPKGKVEFIDIVNGEYSPINVQISDSLADFISKIKLKDELANKKPKVPGEEKPKSTGLRALLNPDPDYVEPLITSKEKYILESQDTDENTTSFKNALQWGFDSLANQHDHTMSFIQLSVALEAILGIESNRGEGLTLQLADRCAYFIGKNNTDRRKIRADFKEFYGVRSTLLHGRSRKISKSEAEWLDWGRNTLDHILRKDLFYSKFE